MPNLPLFLQIAFLRRDLNKEWVDHGDKYFSGIVWIGLKIGVIPWKIGEHIYLLEY